MELNKEKIVLKTFEDAILKYDEGNLSANLYVPPHGDKQLNEVMDSVYYGGSHIIPYHCHDRGVETLIILKGRVKVTICGKTCVCEEGDFINIPAHCPYGLVTLDDDCLIRGLYTDLNMISQYKDRALISRNALNYKYDEEFIKKEYHPAHNYLELTEPVDTEEVDKDSLPQITSKEDSIYTYDGWEGLGCKLKVGRWNLKNLKEVWEFSIDKGYQMQYFNPNENERVYTVKSGKIKIEVNGDVLFAEKDDIIHIPQYTPYAITAMTDDTVIHDYNVSTKLFRMLEMLELAQRDEPEKVKDSKWIKWLLELNNSYLTGFIKTDIK